MGITSEINVYELLQNPVGYQQKMVSTLNNLQLLGLTIVKLVANGRDGPLPEEEVECLKWDETRYNINVITGVLGNIADACGLNVQHLIVEQLTMCQKLQAPIVAFIIQIGGAGLAQLEMTHVDDVGKKSGKS